MTSPETPPPDNLPVLYAADLERFRTVGWWLSLAESGEKSARAQGAAAALRLYYADSLELPPLAAAELSVINGRLFVGAKLLRALAAQRGYRVTKIESTAETCTAALVEVETGEEVGRSTFTIDDAKRAGLIKDRSAWNSHPARMLWARASKYVLDDYAPAITLGIYTDDERAEILEQPAPLPNDETWADFTPEVVSTLDVEYDDEQETLKELLEMEGDEEAATPGEPEPKPAK
jgi:hypothetical protein